MIDKCKYCNSKDLTKKLVTFKNDTIHMEVRCNECERVLGYDKTVDNDNFKMPNGRYKGKTIKEIVKIDLLYALNYADRLPANNIVKRFIEILKSRGEK